jgi:predicted patatin/cPLA2 family phospholipase
MTDQRDHRRWKLEHAEMLRDHKKWEKEHKLILSAVKTLQREVKQHAKEMKSNDREIARHEKIVRKTSADSPAAHRSAHEREKKAHDHSAGGHRSHAQDHARLMLLVKKILAL